MTIAGLALGTRLARCSGMTRAHAGLIRGTLLVLFGVDLFQFTRSPRSRGIGQSALALGLVFLGIKTIKDGSALIPPTGDLATLLDLAQPHPLVMGGAAVITTMLLQSSTATIALVIGIVSGTKIDIPL